MISEEQVVIPNQPSPKLRPVASVWHTLLVLSAMTAWGLIAFWRRSYLLSHPEFNRIPMYLRMILVECALATIVVWGVHKSGGSLQTLLGRQWRSAGDFFRDAGIAALFWIVALIVTGTVRSALPSPTAVPPAATSNSESAAQTDSNKEKNLGATGDSSEAKPQPPKEKTEPIRRPRLSGRIPSVLLRMAPHGKAEILIWLWLSMAAGICEEIVFRGYLQMQFASWIGTPLSVLLTSSVFGFGHWYQGRNSAIAIGFYGLLLALLALYRKSLLPGIIAHSWQDMISGLLLGLLRR